MFKVRHVAVRETDTFELGHAEQIIAVEWDPEVSLFHLVILYPA